MQLEYFRMIDRVERVDPVAHTILCHSTIPAASPVFEGHFPGHPLMPGTLMIEMIAQGCGLLVMALQDFARMPVLIQVEKAKIRSMVAPGTALAVEGRVVQEGSAYVAVAGRLVRDGRAVAEAEIRLGILPFPSAQLRSDAMRFAREIGLTAAG